MATATELGAVPVDSPEAFGAIPLDAPRIEAQNKSPEELGAVPLDPEPNKLWKLFEAFSASQAKARVETQAAEKSSNEKLLQFSQTPLLTLDAATILKLNPKLALLGPEGAQGAAEAIASAASEASKPANLALIPTAAAFPEIVAGTMAGLGAKGAGEALGAQSVAAQTGDVKEAARLGAAALISGTQAAIAPAMGASIIPKGTGVPPIIEALPKGAAEIAAAKLVELETLKQERNQLVSAIHDDEQAAKITPEEAERQGHLELAGQIPFEAGGVAAHRRLLELNTRISDIENEHGLPISEAQIIAPEAKPQTATEAASLKIGIMPEGAAEGVQAIKDTATRLDQLREGFSNWVESRDVRSEITRKFDAADNEAKIEGEQIGNRVRLDIPDKLDRDAVTFIVEANGDQAKLADFLAKAEEARNSKAVNAIKRAQENWERLAPQADKVNQLHDAQLEYEQSNGIDPGNVEGYVRHVYDMDAMIGRGRPVLMSRPSGGAGVATSFKKQRAFETYADAIAAGFKPKTFDIADLVQSRITLGERLVNRSQWANSLRDFVDPAENVPIVTSLITQQPKGTQVAPMGYVRQDLMPGLSVAVHEGYADLLSALTGSSRIRANPVGRVLLNGVAGIKHGMLAIDTFHAGRMIYKELALTGKAGHDLGRSLLEYSNEDLQKAVDAGEITAEAAEMARKNRPNAELLVSQGLNVGRVSDALYKDVLKQIPVVGSFNRWVFDKLTRGAMMQSALIEFERLRQLMPEKSEAEVAGLVAKNVNTYFGNLGRQGLWQDPTWLDIMRLVMLAPQWVEGMARTEVGAAMEAGKVPVDLAQGKPLIVGTLAKGVGTGVISAFIANQLLNYATRGHPTWDNPEHGHQLDAFIPEVTGKGTGFFLSPLSIFAELTHDAIRYYEDDPHALKVVSRIFANKMSPVLRAEEVLRTGKDWQGRQLDETWDRIKEAGRALVPAPIPAQPVLPLTGRNLPPGSLQRQITASLGIKTEPAPSADSQLYNLAKRFKADRGIKEPTSEPSEYRDLNISLRNEDWKAARKEYDKLIASKTERTVQNRYRHLTRVLYTGKRSTETAFRQSLNDDQQILFEKARDERSELRSKFFEMLNKE